MMHNIFQSSTEAGVPYSVTVTPVNSAGPGEPASAIGFSEQLS